MITATNILSNWWKKQLWQAKVAALSAFVVGMCTHVTAMTNFFFNHDGVNHFVNVNRDFISNGRWFLKFTYQMHGDTLNQTMGILFEVLFISIVAFLTISKLKTRSNGFAALIGAMLATFPTIVGTNAYGVGMPYFFALLLSAFAVYVIDKGIVGIILSIVALTLSLGTYQAYIGYAVGLFVIIMLLQALQEDANVAKILKAGIKYVFVSLTSCIIYFIIVKLRVYMTGVELSGYRGMDTALSSFSLQSIPQLVLDAYAGVAKFFVLDAYADASIFSVWLYRAVIVFLIINTILIVKKRKVYKEKQLMLLIVFLLMILPLAIHIIVILGRNDSHWLMKYSFVLIPILTIELFDELETDIIFQKSIVVNKKWIKNGVIVFTLVPFILGVGLNFYWFRTTAECYNILRFGQMTALSAATQLCSSLNEAGYTSEIPLAFVGEDTPETFTNQIDVLKTSKISGVTDASFVSTTGRLYSYLKNVIGFAYRKADDEMLEQYSKRSDVIEMPIYPQQGSIQMIDGVMVAKVSKLTPEIIDDTNRFSSYTNEPKVEYITESVQISGSKDRNFVYKTIPVQLKSLTTYRLMCENVELISGNADMVSVALYNKTTQKRMLVKEFSVGESISWEFTTGVLNANQEDAEIFILLYGGEIGKTEGNEVQYKSVILESLPSEG